MAQNVTVVLIDDIDQSEAAETVRFGVDGAAYEIDLSAAHASELRSTVGRYIAVARRIQSAPARARQQPRSRPRTQMDREQSRRIRSWAMERGLLASPRGRIPQHVVDEYEDTMRVASVPFRSPGTAEPEPEGTAAPEVEVRGGGPGLTDGEKQELRTISGAAKPERTIVAGRLRTKGLADR